MEIELSSFFLGMGLGCLGFAAGNVLVRRWGAVLWFSMLAVVAFGLSLVA